MALKAKDCEEYSVIASFNYLITATLLLKRYQYQDAIIGHYKPLEDLSTQPADSESLVRRSLAVLPLDNPLIREIQVHVLQDTDEEVYDDIFLVTNKSSQMNEFLDGTLYVDFSKRPGPRRLSVIPKKMKGELQCYNVLLLSYNLLEMHTRRGMNNFSCKILIFNL